MDDEGTGADQPLDADELMGYYARIEALPPEDAAWVGRLLQECMRARLREAELLADSVTASAGSPEAADIDPHLAQLTLDAAEWLKVLWEIGYMGAGSFPARPRSDFPCIELQDVLHSALFARIRQGKRPLPFPPPTRNGLPWHDLLEGEAVAHTVDAELIRDEDGTLLGARIESSADWRIVEEISAGGEYLVQYQGKGALYRLTLDAFFASVCRLPPRWQRRILVQERGGVRSFMLEWPKDDGTNLLVPLRATHWQGAESAAANWLAAQHPEMYGQVSFEPAAP